MLLTLIKSQELEHFSLPEKISGRHWITHLDNVGHKQNLLSINAENGKWVVHSSSSANLIENDVKTASILLKPGRYYKLIIENSAEQVLLYVQNKDISKNTQFRKMVLPLSGELFIGRQSDCDICFDNKFVSGEHAIITMAAEGCTIKDIESPNGTFVNGRRITKSILLPGDVVYIVGLLLVIGKGIIAINNPGGNVKVNTTRLLPLTPQKREISQPPDIYKTKANFFCSPRFLRKIQPEALEIDAPPPEEIYEPMPLALIVGPALTMAAMSIVTGAVAILNFLNGKGDLLSTLPAVVMSVVMLIAAVVWPALSRRNDKKQRLQKNELRIKKYTSYIENMRQLIADICKEQRTILTENIVTVEDCQQRIIKRTRNLWERMPEHDDFLTLRVGIGDIPIQADIRFPQKRFALDNDIMKKLLFGFAHEPKLLRQVPISFSLREKQISAIIGPRGKAMEFVRGLLIQLVALHSYEEIKLVLLCDENEIKQWSFAKWLPHCFTTDNNLRLLAYTPEEVKTISAYLEKELTARLDSENQSLSKPHYVIIAASQKLAGKMRLLAQLQKTPDVQGFSVLYMYDSLDKLPRECSLVADLGGTESFIYDRGDVVGNRISFIPDISVKSDMESLAIHLANTNMELEGEQYVIPKMLTFLEMFKVGKVEHLNPLQRWKENNPVLSLRTPIGVDSKGDTFELDLHEKFHGPHGLVAGMTGSGKSEFIITFILSMAVNYHPDEVSFILIDYKGGGLAGAFDNNRVKLPHLAGTITNLDGSQIYRALASIQSELRRRQSLLNQACQATNEGTIDIYKYQLYYRNGVVKEPLPHLFIISDEFAELKSQQSEFMEQLISAARIGRSLGVHLILATQKPSGIVDDQIWSNSRFRICLKVQERADSMDVLKRPDASELRETGRFYLQVGYGELFALGQSAWGGARYLPTDFFEEKRYDTVSVLDNTGQVLREAKPVHKVTTGEQTSQLLAVLDHLSLIAKEEGLSAKQLWQEPIHEIITEKHLREKYNLSRKSAQTPELIVGEYDDPANQRKALLTLPLGAEGNAIVYGATGSGKSTFLSMLTYSLISSYTPMQANLYILDFGAETLKMYASAPHVGAVIFGDEEAKVASLFKMLDDEVNRRKKILAVSNGSFEAYNNDLDSSDTQLPAIIVMINNYDVFSEQYEDISIGELVTLVREGTRVGLYFVITASSTSAVRYRTAQHFPLIFTLQLNDTLEYSGVLGNTGGVYPSKFKGRGLVKLDKVYEFQTAYPTDNVENIAYEMHAFADQKAKQYSGYKAASVPAMPEVVSLADFDKQISAESIPIGLTEKTFEKQVHDFSSACMFTVLSDEIENCQKFLDVLLSVLNKFTDAKIDIIDPMKRYLNLGQNNMDMEQRRVGEMVVEAFNTVVNRHNDYKTSIEDGLELPVFSHQIFVINGLSDVWDILNDDEADKLKIMMERVMPTFNINFIIVDSAAGASGFASAGWYKQSVSSGSGIWVGNRITEQINFSLTSISKDMYKNIDNGYGYYISRGKAQCVKLLEAFSNKKEEKHGEYCS